MPHRVVDELNKEAEGQKTRLVELFITKSGLDPDFTLRIVGQDIFCTLPTEEQIEDAMIDASYHNGSHLDPLARDPRFRRFILAKCITRVSDTAFDEGDEPLKRQFLGHLPQLIFDRIWEDFIFKRDEFIMILAGLGEAVGKSQASPSGEEDGSSSEPQGASPSTPEQGPEASSQDSTPSN